MTDADKIKRVKELVALRVRNGSPAKAKKRLIKEGILKRNGKLAPEYGGEADSARKRAVKAA